MGDEQTLAIAAGLIGYGVGGVLGIVVHEAGHTLTALWLGCEPRAVTIGRGPVVFRFRVGRVWLVWRAAPVCGFAARLVIPRRRRLARAWVIAAGPLATLALLIPAVAVFALDFGSSILISEAASGVAMTQALLLFRSLAPRKYKIAGPLTAYSDGYQLLEIFHGKDGDELTLLYRWVLHSILDAKGPLPAPSSAAPELIYQLSRRDLKEAWAQEDSAENLLKLLKDNRLNEFERALIEKRSGIDQITMTDLQGSHLQV